MALGAQIKLRIPYSQIKLRIPYSPIAFLSVHIGIDSFKQEK